MRSGSNKCACGGGGGGGGGSFGGILIYKKTIYNLKIRVIVFIIRSV